MQKILEAIQKIISSKPEPPQTNAPPIATPSRNILQPDQSNSDKKQLAKQYGPQIAALKAIMAEADGAKARKEIWSFYGINDFRAWAPGKEFLERTKGDPLGWMIAIRCYAHHYGEDGHAVYLIDLLKWYLRQKSDFKLESVIQLYKASIDNRYGGSCGIQYTLGYDSMVKLLEKAEPEDRTPEYLEFVSKIAKEVEQRMHIHGNSVEYQAIQARYRAILEPGGATWILSPWQEKFASASPNDAALYAHIAAAKSVKPTAKWSAETELLLAKCDPAAFVLVVEQTLPLVKETTMEIGGITGDFARGIAWTLGLIGTPRAVQLLADWAVVCNQKLPGVGARCPKGFDGAVTALDGVGTVDALAAISNLKIKVQENQLRKKIIKALESGAEKMGVSVNELEEIVVPDYGLDANGILESQFGDVTAKLCVGPRDVALTFFKGDKEIKSLPKETASHFKEEIKELKALQKQIETTLRAQRGRLESLYLQNRPIPVESWKSRYFDHPLLSNAVKNLIWKFGDQALIFQSGEWKDLRGKPAAIPANATEVDLWHPLFADPGHVRLWRDLIFANTILQPFKQAFREVYILTDAEINTNLYSNRFAAHILKQHQMAALGRVRGWRVQLQGFFDAEFEMPSREIPAWNLRARFYVQFIDTIEDDGMTDAGIANYVTSDLVEFLDPRMERVRLSEVPPIVFSELMRDVDLFVGVASIANDPTWLDHTNRPQQYWHTYSFGDLSESAKSRREILARLLPRLNISKVATLEEKFLVIDGKMRTYKIHLGSGNILMAPNDQYLCIVPGNRVKADDLSYVPIEGDNILSIIISKAILLSEDDKITDSTIVTQIRR